MTRSPSLRKTNAQNECDCCWRLEHTSEHYNLQPLSDVIQSKYCNKSDNECARENVAFALFSRSRNRDLRHTVKNVSTQRVIDASADIAHYAPLIAIGLWHELCLSLILSENVFEGDCQKGKIIEADDSVRRPKNKNQDQEPARAGTHSHWAARRRAIHPMCCTTHARHTRSMSS